MAVDAEVDFIRVAVQTGITMMALARTERQLQEPTAALQAITKAREALESAKRFLPMLKDVGQGTLGDLRRAIAELESAIRDDAHGT